MAYSTVTLSGTYQTFDGEPAVGRVEIIPSVPQVIDEDGEVVLSGRVKVTLDAQGAFSVALPATDDANLTPTGFGYTLAARLRHTHLTAVSFELPAAVPAVDITEVTSLDPADFTPDINYATQDEHDDLQTEVTTLTTTVGTKAAAADLTAETAAREAADDDLATSVTAETFARTAADAVLDGRVAALEAWLPGTELGYAEITADFTTTNTSTTNTTDGPGAGGVIPSFSVTVEGTGRPVEVEFYAPQVRHTTANQWVSAYLIVNGTAQSTSGQTAFQSSPVTTIGRPLLLKRRLVLTDGVSYTFKVGISGGAAGTSTVDASDSDALNKSYPSLTVLAR